MSEDKVRAGERLTEGGEAGRIGVGGWGGGDSDKRRNELRWRVGGEADVPVGTGVDGGVI